MAMKNAKQKQKKKMQNIENAKIKTAMLGVISAYTTIHQEIKTMHPEHCHWAPKCCPHNRDTETRTRLPTSNWRPC